MNDESIMPFGKHSGKKLANVPASYLLWLLKESSHLRDDLKKYIEDNKADLEKEVNANKNNTDSWRKG